MTLMSVFILEITRSTSRHWVQCLQSEKLMMMNQQRFFRRFIHADLSHFKLGVQHTMFRIQREHRTCSKFLQTA